MTPTWQALGFAITARGRWSYGSFSTGSGSTAMFEIRAEPDQDCNGAYQRWSIFGSIDTTGAVVTDGTIHKMFAGE